MRRQRGQFLGNAVHTVFGRQRQQRDVAGIAAALLGGLQAIIDLAVDRAREEFLPVDVAGEGTGLALQGGDDVAEVDTLAPGAEPGTTHHLHAFVPDAHLGLADVGLHPGPDQPGRHGVGGVFDPNRREAAHPQGVFLGLWIQAGRQRSQARHLLGGALGSCQVGGGADLGDKRVVLGLAGKVPRAPQRQMVFEPPLQGALSRFKIAVLIGLVRGIEGVVAEEPQPATALAGRGAARQVSGLLELYGVIGNSKSLQVYWRGAKRLVFKWWNRRSQRRSYNWTTFEAMWQTLGLPVPHIVETPYLAQRLLPLPL